MQSETRTGRPSINLQAARERFDQLVHDEHAEPAAGGWIEIVRKTGPSVRNTEVEDAVIAPRKGHMDPSASIGLLAMLQRICDELIDDKAERNRVFRGQFNLLDMHLDVLPQRLRERPRKIGTQIREIAAGLDAARAAPKVFVHLCYRTHALTCLHEFDAKKAIFSILSRLHFQHGSYELQAVPDTVVRFPEQQIPGHR